MPGYATGSWTSDDGIRLHYRDYAGRADRPPILCIPGLTRNARDFEAVAARLAGAWRVIAVDLRGRGASGYAEDAATYTPVTYVQDLARLTDQLRIERFVAFGTSLGGIVTMLFAACYPARIVGALLNDIGPVLEPAGLARIRSYVGKPVVWASWAEAARAVAEGNADAYPDYTHDDWLVMARRLYREEPAGRIVLDYDMAIAEPFRAAEGAAPPDMWPLFAALRGTPLVILRGERSDVLSAATGEAMAARHGGARLVTVPRVGHAPTLAEPAAAAALEELLAAVDQTLPALSP